VVLRDPHAGQSVVRRGPAPADASLVAILVHGRGATAESILSVAEAIDLPNVSYLAPQAAGRTWYPHSFLTPMEQNEPFLTSALGALSAILADLEGRGIPADRVAFVGFSQGGCLSLEYIARHARRYAAVAGLSAGLIGPPGTPRDYPGSLSGTPVLLGCSDIDAHIPLARVHESADVLGRLGAVVDQRIYPAMGHTINQDEIEAVRAMLAAQASR
jgi:predicted esterase